MSEDPSPKHPEKLSDRLEIRLHASAKRRFLAACRRTGDVPSDVLRMAMKDYVAKVQAAERSTLATELFMTLIQNPLKSLATVGTSIAAVVLFAASPSVADPDLQPINAPIVTYPIAMAEQGLGAECKAMFDVTAAGVPENIKIDCTHPGFAESMTAAAQTLRFEPKMDNGIAVPRKGVVYPIVYQLDNDIEITLEERFAKLDEDGDGLLSNSENISQDWLNVMDRDRDGKASFSEYERYLAEQSAP